MDIRTLLIVNVYTSCLLALMLAVLGQKHSSRSLTLGAFSLGLIGAGLFIIALRETIGVSVAAVSGNSMISIGLALMSETILSFQRRTGPRVVIWLPVPALIASVLLLLDDVSARIVLSSALYAMQTLIVAAITYSGRKRTYGWGWQLIVVASLFYGASFSVRSIASLSPGSGILDMFSEGWVQSQAFVVSFLALICVAIGIMAIYAGQVEEQVRQSEEKNRSIVENANDVIYVIDPDGKVEFISKRSRDVIGHDAGDLLGTKFHELVHPDDVPKCQAAFEEIVSKTNEIAHLQYRVRTADGRWVWHETSVGPILDVEGAVSGVLGIGRDVSYRKLQESQLERRAYYDPLTELPNRALIVDRADQSLRLAKRDNRQSAMLFLDLDRFKAINDAHGHAIGDAVLKAAALRLQGTLRGSDSVGRLGGDEFLVVLHYISGVEDAVEASRRIGDALSIPVTVGSVSVEIGCSIGIACFPDHGDDLDALLNKADDAMYKAKRSGTRSHLADWPEARAG